jgi:hypothetical protein
LVLYGGEVLTCALPGRSHWVVVGEVFVHWGTAPAGGAATMTPTHGASADMAIDFLKRRRLKRL